MSTSVSFYSANFIKGIAVCYALFFVASEQSMRQKFSMLCISNFCHTLCHRTFRNIFIPAGLWSKLTQKKVLALVVPFLSPCGGKGVGHTPIFCARPLRHTAPPHPALLCGARALTQEFPSSSYPLTSREFGTFGNECL